MGAQSTLDLEGAGRAKSEWSIRRRWSSRASSLFPPPPEERPEKRGMSDVFMQSGTGDCMNLVEVARPSEAFLTAALREAETSSSDATSSATLRGPLDDEDEDDDAHERITFTPGEKERLVIGPKKRRKEKKSLFRRLAVNATSVVREGGVLQPTVDLASCCRTLGVDVIASLVVFFLTTVIYVSSAQSIFGPFFDSHLVYVGVETMLGGSALIGIFFALSSGVPWAVSAVDVGFVPLLGHVAEICYHEVVVHGPTGARTDDLESQFAATTVVAQCCMFVCTGLALYVLGEFRLTRLANYLPYPVTAGLLASIGVSLAKSGLSVANKVGFEHSISLGLFWSVAAFALTILSYVMKHSFRIPAYVVTPLVVIFGSVALFIGALIAGVPHSKLATEYGALFSWVSTNNGFWLWTTTTSTSSTEKKVLLLSQVDWRIALFKSREVYVAAMVIGALKIGIKCGSFAAMFPAADLDVDAEMRLVGLAHLSAGLLGTSGQAPSFSGIKVQQQLGASNKMAALMNPMWCLGAWFFGVGGLLAFVPRFVFGALLIELGVDYVDTYLVYPLRSQLTFEWKESSSSRQKPRSSSSLLTSFCCRFHFPSVSGKGNLDVFDAATLCSIVILAVVSNLLEAIALGLVLSLVGVSRRLAQRSIIASVKGGGHEVRSTIERPTPALRVLAAKGDAIFVVDLVGYVFFGSAHEVVDAVVDRAKHPRLPPLKHLVVDISRCFPQFDVTAVAALEKLLALADARDFDVALAPRQSEQADALDAGITACHGADLLFQSRGRWFESVDDALETCEDDILATEWSGHSQPRMPSRVFSSSLKAAMSSAQSVSQDPTEARAQDNDDEDVVGIALDDDDDDDDDDDEKALDSKEKLPHQASSHGKSALASFAADTTSILKRKDLIRTWLAASAAPLDALFRLDAAQLDHFVDTLAEVLRVSKDPLFVDADGDQVMKLLVDGRVRLLTPQGLCVRKLADGSAVGLGDFYAVEDQELVKVYTLVPTSPKLVFLDLKYKDLAQLEVDHPDVAIMVHKLMARSLAQKNRNSKLAHRIN